MAHETLPPLLVFAAWFKANPLGAPADAPLDEPQRAVVTPLAGMLAGSCMINWTTVIHRRADNNTDSPRRTFWQVFCREGFDLGGRLCGHLSEQYRAAQTIPGTFVTFLLVFVCVSVCLSVSLSVSLCLSLSLLLSSLWAVL